MRPYKFSVELEALREQISQEHSLRVKYLRPQYSNIEPIVILLNTFLREIKDKDERRRVRLAMLSLWVGQELETTYDLTVYQCSIIPMFLELEDNGCYGSRTERFLSDTQAHVEGRVVQGEDEYHPLRNDNASKPARLLPLT